MFKLLTSHAQRGEVEAAKQKAQKKRICSPDSAEDDTEEKGGLMTAANISACICGKTSDKNGWHS
jgi:hypothetical protein